VERRFSSGDDMLGFQMAFDVTGDPAFPEQEAFKVARELGAPVTTHAGVWGATNDDGIRLMHEHGCMTPETIYVHAATLEDDSYHRIAATGGSVSVSTESEQSAGQGYPPTWRLRRHDIPVSLSMDTSVWWSGDLFSAMRVTLGADRSREHLEAHARQETITNHHLRAEQVVDWATRGGSRALRLDAVVGSLEEGKKADVVLIKNDDSPVMFPVLHPYGHVAFQAQRADVHTVLVNGRVVKRDGKLVGVDLRSARQAVEETVEFAMGTLGEEAWTGGMHPEIPERRILENPYQYTEWDAGSAQWKR
jgi:5-methylthioadenosine/S-adenosylhomocysteine deaminase